MQDVHQIRITVDERHQVVDVVLLEHYDQSGERVRPMGWGPFDTPGEALQAALRALPEQGVLF